MARKKNNIQLKPVLFIACEGTSSEFQYFESWAQAEEVLENFSRVVVYPDEKENRPKTTPYELLAIAKEKLQEGSADFAWVVFDKDMHPKLKETFAEAEGVGIAFSSRSFEEWVLLHFEKNQMPFQATECKTVLQKPLNCGTVSVPDCSPIDCLTGHIRRQNFIPDYSKKKSFDLHTHIYKKSEIAIVNAAWLRFKKNLSLNKTQSSLTNQNPYSDVDQLIFILTGREDKIEWTNLGNPATLNDWTICVNKNNGSIKVQLSHVAYQAKVLNADFPVFYTTNDQLNDSICNNTTKIYIENTNGSNDNLLYSGDIIEYTLLCNDDPYLVFYEKNSFTRIYVEL
jgi:hypothetical protein